MRALLGGSIVSSGYPGVPGSALPQAANPTLDSRYQILEPVAEGATAVVYRARDTRLNRVVAIKLLKPTCQSDPDTVERLRREAHLIARLTHPNIVAVYDWLADPSAAYIVMEYVAGESLRDRLERRGTLPADEAIAIASQILAGLEAAHRAGIVHRDIKPENVLLGHDGATKLIDFGIALAPAASTLTQSGLAIGTPAYLSPEQAQGREATPASDLYSTGAVIYEMLVGKPPFRGESALAIATQHVISTPTPPREHRPGIPAELEHVVLRSLAKKPEDRWSDASIMATALDTCARHASASTASTPVVRLTIPWLRSRFAANFLRVRALARAPRYSDQPTHLLAARPHRARPAAARPRLTQRSGLAFGSPLRLAGVALVALLALTVVFAAAMAAGSQPPMFLGARSTSPGQPTPPADALSSPSFAQTIRGLVVGATATPTPSPTPTDTATPTNTPTSTVTPSATPTLTPTKTPTSTPTPTRTPTRTPTIAPTATNTPLSTATPTPMPRPLIVELTVPPLAKSEHRIGGTLATGSSIVGTIVVRGGRDDIAVVIYDDASAATDPPIWGPASVLGTQSFTWQVKQSGNWRIVFDNTMSFFTTKRVTFSYRVVPPD